MSPANPNRYWGDLSLRLKGATVITIPALALIATALATYSIAVARQDAQAWVTHTFEVRTALHLAKILREAD